MYTTFVYFKTSAVDFKQLQDFGVTSNLTRIEGNQFSVVGMKLHPF